ncbi:hypothetical protein GRAN_3299 [Granulicella sibirica]|uniref:Uncharacterized protein n=2 Tax=Granulicella sibirica TaxID=2479048 RepID=A0A4Q0T112_9BACT|nr:hypothetical protein GRAN_3299 [Granulicella sibirica]
MDAMKTESQAEKIRFDVRNDEVAIESARLQGTGVDEAERRLSADQRKQSELQATLREQQALASAAEDDRVAAARKRLEAARSSANVYRDWLALDEKLAYALGVVWMAFGVVVAFMPKK